ncbi:MAG: hypothetical protein JWQ38_2008 [Flavipsychrobacter sp.]|nr:hypothetical protein [Flavipsychrobacter sp.]
MMNSPALKKTILLGAICIITFLCFRYTVNNQFTNWDDDFYVTNDPYIKAFTPHNLKVIFTEDITKNNYHPLCMLSLAINYHFSQMDPHAYYLTNILIHVANVMLVFFLMMALCALLQMDEKGKLFVASFAALFFGIHPMHVESVAWIAERKDVLYAFFYILGLLCYLKYLATNKMSWYWLTFIVFIASCLSKPMAVVFPMSLLCIDILAKRQLSKKLVTEKILFFLFSLICGGMAFYTQNKTGAIASFGILTIYERIMYAGYSFIMYVSKLFNPTYLSTFYPYPYRFVTGYLPGIYYAAPFLALTIAGLPVWITYQYKREYFRPVAFGMGFFVANVIFILQFISVGAAIMADRYSYVAYIGLLFLLGYFINELIRNFPKLKIAVFAVLICVAGWFSYMCYERTFAWHDSESLLSDAIEKYPVKKDPDMPHDSKNSGVALLSYKWRGNLYFSRGELNKALSDYNVMVMLRSADAKTFDKIGNIYFMRKQYDSAIIAYTQSLEVQNNVMKTYADRSMAYMTVGDTVNAFKDFIIAYQMDPQSLDAFSESVFNAVQKQQYDLAINEYNMLLKVISSNPFYYFYRGVAKFGKGETEAAIIDWEIAVKYNSKDVQQSASYNLAVAYEAKGDYKKAVDYILMAKRTGYAVTDEYMATLQKKLAESKK